MRKENTMEQHGSTEAPLCDACRRLHDLEGRPHHPDPVVRSREWALAGGLPVRIRRRLRGARRPSCSARPV
jgi:hypothetical protein